MKKISSRFFVMVLGLLAASNNINAQIDSSVKITLYSCVCPAIEAGPAVWTPWVNSVQSFWAGTSSESAAIEPSRFHAITAGRWEYICVNNNPSSSFSLWLGQPTPGGTNKGNGISFPFKIESPNSPATLSNVRVTLISWETNANSTNYLGRVETYTRYWPETLGIRPSDGNTMTSEQSTTPAKEIRSVGPRIAFSGASSQTGINAIRDYPIPGVSCIVEVFRNGIVVATKRLDIPFNPSPSMLTQVNQSSIRVNGTANQQYRVELASELPNWQPFGLPVDSGVAVNTPSDTSQKFFRALQGP